MTALLDVDQLRTFIAIVESGSFTRAADVVHKTQSAVSMQMKRLEERLERPIFTRDGRASKLTEDGERLLDYARRIDDSVSRATVYRTLPIMTRSALLREIDIGSGEKFYLANLEENTQIAQVVCIDCDRIFEISAPFMEWYGSTVSSKLGLTPVSQRLQVSARCNVLRETGSCPRRG